MPRRLTTVRTLSLMPAFGLLLACVACGPSDSSSTSVESATEPSTQSSSISGERFSDPEQPPIPSSAAPSSIEAPAPSSALSKPSAEAPLNRSDDEQAYIDEVGEEGVYAGAVLEAGIEACERLEYLTATNPEIVVGAVASNEIPNAPAAVDFLCPEFEEVKEEALGGFGDGTFPVGAAEGDGKSVLAGTYTSIDATETCTWSVSDVSGGLLEQGTAGSMVVSTDAGSVTSSGCYAWVPAD